MRIGSAWIKTTDTGNVYLSVSIDEAALPLTLTEDKYLTLWEIPEGERKTENAPHYAFVLSKPKAKEDK
ncbi:MAG: hypothetical protein IKR34_02160 [Candidatus Gastranaerophilales bacterium]|nr:hypothetical protein [Elusimicrobiota bacterium]MBR6298027.1 hypothetical protein [Candidatus Gastranaerophilales bacterium]